MVLPGKPTITMDTGSAIVVRRAKDTVTRGRASNDLTTTRGYEREDVKVPTICVFGGLGVLSGAVLFGCVSIVDGGGP